jgi:hypothetical protein
VFLDGGQLKDPLHLSRPSEHHKPRSALARATCRADDQTYPGGVHEREPPQIEHDDPLLLELDAEQLLLNGRCARKVKLPRRARG